MSAQPLEFEDFSGGVTDYFVGAPRNKYEEADNLLIFKYGSIGRLFTRPGSELWDEDNPQIPVGAQRIGTLKYFGETLFVQSSRKFYYVSAGSFTTLQGPSSNDVFATGVAAANFISIAEGQDHLLITSDAYQKVQKVYHDGTNYQLRTAGLPVLASSPAVTAGAAGSGRYIYRFHYRYTYTVGTLTFEDNGPTTEVVLESAAAPEANAVAITVIPALANSTTHNYDTASSNLKVMISRTTDSGQVFYYVGSVNNGTTTFNDNVSDATLATNTPLYTEGGFVESEEPPLCRYVHIAEQVGWYAHCKDGSEVNPRRILQSIPGDIDGVPSDFYCDVDFEITGISSFNGTPLVGTVKGIYRIEGQYTATGQGGTIARKISDTATCVSHNSMVQTPVGVFWAGMDGFYFSDGFRCFKVNKSWDKRYQAIVDTATKQKRVYGKYDPKKNRVYWACSDDAEVDDNNMVWVLHLDWGVSEDMSFTSWSGNSLAPTALEVDTTGNLIRGHKSGFIFAHNDLLYYDPKVEVLVTPSSWVTETIIYNFKSAASNFGTSFERKYVTGVNVVCENETNLSLQAVSINDKGRKVANLAPIRFRGNLVWGEADVFWGDNSIIWNYSGLISEKRRMPSGHLRCDYKQLQLTNAKVAIFNSDLLGTADINATTKTVTLNNGDQEWPTTAIDYFITFEADNYRKEYTITARTDDTITYSDTQNQSSTRAGQRWVIRGYPRNEVLFLIGFNFHYETFGKTQDVYTKNTSGEVGTSS